MKFQVALAEAVALLAQEKDRRFTTVMQHGSLAVEYYAPEGIDEQTPHRQDELYLVASGAGTFYREGERVPFRAGDVLFVPAGMDHRFEDFTPDFATWVVFYGPEGGERSGQGAEPALQFH